MDFKSGPKLTLLSALPCLHQLLRKIFGSHNHWVGYWRFIWAFFFFFFLLKKIFLLLQRHEVQPKFSREDYLNVHSLTPLSFSLFPHFLISWLWPFTAAAIPTRFWHDYINQSCRSFSLFAVVSVRNRCTSPQPHSSPVHYIQRPYWGHFLYFSYFYTNRRHDGTHLMCTFQKICIHSERRLWKWVEKRNPIS